MMEGPVTSFPKTRYEMKCEDGQIAGFPCNIKWCTSTKYSFY